MAFTVGRPFIVFRHLNKSNKFDNLLQKRKSVQIKYKSFRFKTKEKSEYKLIHFNIILCSLSTALKQLLKMPKVVSSVEEYWGEIHSAGEYFYYKFDPQ